MSRKAALAFEGYRNRHPLIETRAGVERLVSGQHQAIWSDEEQGHIELSYCGEDGHTFVVVALNPETLDPLGMMLTSDSGMREIGASLVFELSQSMLAAINELRAQDVDATVA